LEVYLKGIRVAYWRIDLSPKAMAIILKHADVGKRWGLLISMVDARCSGRRRLFMQIVRLLGRVQFDFSKEDCRKLVSPYIRSFGDCLQSEKREKLD
jgi:hypothetical protein